MVRNGRACTCRYMSAGSVCVSARQQRCFCQMHLLCAVQMHAVCTYDTLLTLVTQHSLVVFCWQTAMTQ